MCPWLCPSLEKPQVCKCCLQPTEEHYTEVESRLFSEEHLCKVKKQEAQARDIPLGRKNKYHLWEWPGTGAGAQRGCGVSVLRNIQNRAGHSPEQSSFEDNTTLRRSDQTNRSPFQPEYTIFSVQQITHRSWNPENREIFFTVNKKFLWAELNIRP